MVLLKNADGVVLESTFTTDEGIYYFDSLIVGQYSLKVFHNAYSFLEGSVAVPAGTMATMDFVASTTNLSGSISAESSGLPVAGAIVMLKPLTEKTSIIPMITFSNEVGGYQFKSVTAGDYVIRGQAEGFARKLQTVVISGSMDEQLDLMLAEPHGISGIITDTDTGEPIEGAIVTIYDPAYSPACNSAFATTNEGGAFTMGGLSDGQYIVYVLKNGYVMKNLPAFINEETTFNISLSTQGHLLKGQIIDQASGLPVKDALMVMRMGDIPINLIYSDGQGYFSISPLENGSYIVQVIAHWGNSLQEITIAGDTDLTLPITFTATGNFEFTEYEISNSIQSLPRWRIQYTDENGNTHIDVIGTEVWDDEGCYNFIKSLEEKVASHWRYVRDYGEAHEKAKKEADKLRMVLIPGEEEHINKLNSKLKDAEREIQVAQEELNRFILLKTQVEVTQIILLDIDDLITIVGDGIDPYFIAEELIEEGSFGSDLASKIMDRYIDFQKDILENRKEKKASVEAKIKEAKVKLDQFKERLKYLEDTWIPFLKGKMDFHYFMVQTYLNALNDVIDRDPCLTCNEGGLLVPRFEVEGSKCECEYNETYDYINVTCKPASEPEQEEPEKPLTDPPGKKKEAVKVEGRGARDPNDKLISIGYGTLFHIMPNDRIDYTIRVENKSDALASAQLITVTDPLSPDLDWTTFELGDMEFSNHRIEVPEGLTYYYNRVDLRPEGNNLFVDIEANFDPSTGVATWIFSAIDPETGEFTEDVFAGFLPPNKENHEGEGFVKFSIEPKQGLETGTVIDNMARIIFDWNPPIDTPRIFNTIDAAAPTSDLQTLPIASPHRFEVIWEGIDNDDGSGIAGFDIYVSENGGEYELWLKDTTATSAVYFGTGGNTYAFYSVATDNVGFQEQVPAEYDTITIALVNNPPSDPSLSSPIHMGKVITPTPALTINNSFDTDEDPLTYEFEIYPNSHLNPPSLCSVNAVPEGDSNTSWVCGTTLSEDTWYSWRARAFDGIEYSEWMPAVVFLVNEENFPPSDPDISFPLDQGEVDCLQPALTIINSIDPDGESVSYEFEVYTDSNMANLLTHTSLAETEGRTSWMVPVELIDNTWYYWRTRATDGEAFSDWSSGSFFVNNNGFDDPPAISIITLVEDISTHADSLTISWQDDDPDSNADISLHYDFDNLGHNGTLIADGIKENPDEECDSYLWDISTMAAGTYYVYAVITDGTTSLTNYSQGTISIEALHTYYCDYDGDGYGDPNCTIQDYTKPANFAEYGIDCDDSDPNVNPKEIEMISIENESLSDFTLGRNVLKVFNPSCYPYTSFDLLSDFKELGDSLDFHYRNLDSGTYKSTYLFFNRISGEKVDLEETPPDGDPNALYIIDKSP